jgi:hypothetical protein
VKTLLDTDKTALKCARCFERIKGPIITQNHIPRPLTRLAQILCFHPVCYEEVTKWLKP